MMNILITGHTGLLGTALIKQIPKLDGQIENLYLLSRSKIDPTARDIKSRASIIPVTADLCEIEKIPPDVNTIIHIAGEKKDLSRMRAINHHATSRLAELAASSGVKRFIHISSVGVYGAPPNSGLIDESHSRAPVNLYEETKNDGELAVLAIGKKSKMQCISLQPTNVISSHGYGLPLLSLTRAIWKQRFIWFGKSAPCSNYITAEQIASAIIEVVSRDAAKSGTYILNSPVHLHDIVDTIAYTLNLPAPRRRLPISIGNAIAISSTILTRFFKLSIPFDKERLIELTNTNLFDPAKFQQHYPTALNSNSSILTTVSSLALMYKSQGLLQ